MDYSRNANQKRTDQTKKTRKRHKNRFGVILTRILLTLFVVGCFAVGGALLGAYMGIVENTGQLNIVDITPDSYTSHIYDAEGNEIDMLHGKENREYVQYDQIPDNLKNAVIAIEDERFYDHNGIDIKGIMRAMVINIKEMDMSQGASTITQQLIKNEALTSEKNFTRKIQEQYLAVTLESDLEKKFGSKKRAKDYILELYLNSIALNHGLNGVQTAAKFYYGKDVSELTLAECASIAGITKHPSKYSPVSSPEDNKERQLLVLNKMKELGYITEAEYTEAVAEDIYAKIVGEIVTDENSTALHSYFVDELVTDVINDLVEKKGFSKAQASNAIYSGGLSIYSTQDMNMQKIMDESYADDSLFPPKGNTLDVTYTISVMDKATEKQSHFSRTTTVKTREEVDPFVQSVKDEILNDTNTLVLDNVVVSESLQSAMVIMDQHTGHVKALIGGRGEKPGDMVFNRATQALRQPGSCFKVLAGYAPAFDLGIMTPGTVIVDEPFTVGQWSPKNWYSGYRGASTARAGIKDSMNILAAKTIMEVGIDTAFEYLVNFGFTSLIDKPDENGHTDKGPALALGGITKGVSVMELTAAYAAIANGGEYLKPTLYTKVLDHDGNVLLEYAPESRRVIKENTAFLLTDCMEDVITGGTGTLARFRNYKMNIAGKTGTTTDDKDLTFAGYSPYYTAGIWLGYDQPKKISYDKSYHLLLWRDVMEKVHAFYNLPNKEFEKAKGVEEVRWTSICSLSGLAAISGLCDADYYGSTVTSDYMAENSMSSCNVHRSFKVDMSTGKLANEFCPVDDVKSIVLAIDPGTGAIMNKDSSKGNIDISSTCTEHTDNFVIGGGTTTPPAVDPDDPFIYHPPTEDPTVPPETVTPPDNTTGDNTGGAQQDDFVDDFIEPPVQPDAIP